MDKEIRSIETEIRLEPESRKIVGRAIVFNSITDIGWFKEKIVPEAVDEILLAQDVRALFNHDSNLILARTKSNTLKLEKTEDGLDYSFDAPNTTAGNDLLESLKRGDVSGSSFGFSVQKDSWEILPDGTELRTILKLSNLYDVSPVTFPAYADTTVAKRSKEDFTKEDFTPAIPLSVRRKELELMAARH